jgi:hypothetical protein
MRGRWSLWKLSQTLFAIVLLGLFVPATGLAQSAYTFTKIADTLQDARLGGAGCVSVGNSGTVLVMFAGHIVLHTGWQPVCHDERRDRRGLESSRASDR